MGGTDKATAPTPVEAYGAQNEATALADEGVVGRWRTTKEAWWWTTKAASAAVWWMGVWRAGDDKGAFLRWEPSSGVDLSGTGS